MSVDDAPRSLPAASNSVRFTALYGTRTSCTLRRSRLGRAQPVAELFVPHPDRAHHEAARGDVRETCADGTLALTQLGTRPSVTLAEGLRRQIEWAMSMRGVPALAA